MSHRFDCIFFRHMSPLLLKNEFKALEQCADPIPQWSKYGKIMQKHARLPTFYEFLSSLHMPGTRFIRNFSKNVDFSLWNKQCGFPKLHFFVILCHTVGLPPTNLEVGIIIRLNDDTNFLLLLANCFPTTPSSLWLIFHTV